MEVRALRKDLRQATSDVPTVCPKPEYQNLFLTDLKIVKCNSK